jgi:malonyl-CoA O-methyltransferase
MNNKLIIRKFGKSIDTYDDNAYAQKEIANRLSRLIVEIYPDTPNTVLEIGCGTGLMTRNIRRLFPDAYFYLNDINERYRPLMRQLLSDNRFTFIAGDAQTIDFPRGIDLIVSSSTIQWFDGLNVFASRAYRAMATGGYMFLSTFGKNNLKEIRALTGTGLEYPSTDTLNKVFANGFETLYLDEDEIHVTFNSSSEILSHFRQTGVNANCSGIMRTLSGLKSFCTRYDNMFSDGSKVILTYNPVYLVLKKK